MNDALGQFVRQIMSLGPGGRWPNSGGDVTQRLKQSTAQFAQALQEPQNYSKAQVQALAQEIEGLLMAEGTVNGWSQATTDSLIDTLHDLSPGE
ncbi:MAG TPA: hypothetical protein VK712_03755 [Verrucomicrobiae bacterium]|jgi:hypothetical protein|nr:hypothetical protein [Verrucomicrobiae bacterium]